MYIIQSVKCRLFCVQIIEITLRTFCNKNVTIMMVSRVITYLSDLRPIYLIYTVAPDKNSLPPGIEIIYDSTVNIHAFHFTPRVQHLSFPAAEVFRSRFLFLYTEHKHESSATKLAILVSLKIMETNRATPEWDYNLLWRNSIVFNERCIAEVIAALTLH